MKPPTGSELVRLLSYEPVDPERWMILVSSWTGPSMCNATQVTAALREYGEVGRRAILVREYLKYLDSALVGGEDDPLLDGYRDQQVVVERKFKELLIWRAKVRDHLMERCYLKVPVDPVIEPTYTGG